MASDVTGCAGKWKRKLGGDKCKADKCKDSRAWRQSFICSSRITCVLSHRRSTSSTQERRDGDERTVAVKAGKSQILVALVGRGPCFLKG